MDLQSDVDLEGTQLVPTGWIIKMGQKYPKAEHPISSFSVLICRVYKVLCKFYYLREKKKRG